MLTDFLAERGKLVFTTHGESDDLPIGQLVDCVIDPDTGRIKAWWVRGLDGYKVFLPADVSYWGKHRIVIKDENDLSKPEDLPRMRKYFEKEVSIIEAMAFSQEKKIGRVKNFSFDTNFFLVLSFSLKGKWWVSPTRIISIRMVDKIDEKGVFFCSNYAKGVEKIEKKSEEEVLPEAEMD